MRYTLALCLLLCLAPETALQTQTRLAFVDVAAKAGLTRRNTCGSLEKRYLIEVNGNGCGFLDYNNDGLLDIILIDGSTIENFKLGGDQICYLYKNNGDGSFTDVTREAKLTHKGWGSGVCVGDYDNDGWGDIYITCLGRNVLFRNNGDGTFADVTATAGVGDARWGSGAAFLDYDRDGDLDLFVANYVDMDVNNLPQPGSSRFCEYRGIKVACGPRGLKGSGDSLYRNNGDGTFTDVSLEAGVSDPQGLYGLGVVCGDYDNDGDTDIYVANDSVPNFLYRNNGDGTFTDVALMAGVAVNEDGREQAGMGVDFGDYDNDGWLDIYVTNFSDDTNTLYHNDGNGSFTDVTFPAGHGITWTYLGWGTGFVDFDNDGWLDIFVANGHIYPVVDAFKLGTTYRQRSLLFLNQRDKTFKEVGRQSGPGFAIERSFRGAAFADYDNDGDIDALVSAINDPPLLLRNDGGNRNSWITIKLVGVRSNRDGIGARVKIVCGGLAQIAEVRSGSSYMSQNDMRVHFGLGSGPLRKIDQIQVRWPTGARQVFKDVAPNQILIINEEMGIVSR